MLPNATKMRITALHIATKMLPKRYRNATKTHIKMTDIHTSEWPKSNERHQNDGRQVTDGWQTY